MDAHSALNLVLILILLVLLCCQYTSTKAAAATQSEEQFSDSNNTAASQHFTPVQPHDSSSLQSDRVADSTLQPDAFVHPPSVYSSMPAESDGDGSWKYTRPYQEACLGQCSSGGCSPGQKLTCVLTPHNQRVCSWK